MLFTYIHEVFKLAQMNLFIICVFLKSLVTMQLLLLSCYLCLKIISLQESLGYIEL